MNRIGLFAATAAIAFCAVAPAMADEEIGVVFEREFRGAEGTRTSGETRDLRWNEPVFSEETVMTGPDAHTELQFVDQTHLSVGANSQVVLDSFVYDPSQGTGDAVITFGKGFFRFVTGDMNKDAYQLETPSATLAIRGTIFQLLIDQMNNVIVYVEEGAVEIFPCDDKPGGVINAGNFSTTLLTENALPLTAAAGLGKLPIFGAGTTPRDPSSSIPAGCGNAGVMCSYNAGPGGASTYGNSGINGGWSGSGGQIGAAVRALERDGLIRTLAEPNLTAVSGEPAKFLAGGEYPVPVVDNIGALSVQYKEFGVGLAFTPIVLSEGRISLKIETEVSELTTQGAVVLSGISIPALKKRQAKSTVELPSGGTLALAGLISDDTRQNIDGLPGAKDIPILGTLFRSRDFIKAETELVVIVTPYLVKPTSRQELVTPADGLYAATDMKANFLGHLNKIYGKGEAPIGGDLKGDYGFIVE